MHTHKKMFGVSTEQHRFFLNSWETLPSCGCHLNQVLKSTFPESKNYSSPQVWGTSPVCTRYLQTRGLRGAESPRLGGARSAAGAWASPAGRYSLPAAPFPGRGVCVANSIPVGLSVWSHSQPGGLAASARPRPPYPLRPRAARAPGVIPVYGEISSKFGSISALAPLRGPARPGSGEKSRRSCCSPFPSPSAGRGRAEMTPKPAGPPDGGWGWVVAASAFAVNGLSYGLLRSLGLALPDLAEHFDRNAQETAWVSALALAVQQAASPVGSALSTRWGARPVVMVGGVLASLGFVSSAFARSLLHLYLGLGLLAGSGWALVFAPALGTLSRYFSRRRVLAVGLALTGNGAASLLLAPALQLLLDTFGWRGALLLLGAITLHLTPCGALLRPLALPGDPPASSRGPLAALGLGLFTRRAFSVFALGTALVGGGYFVPYVHLAPHALDRGLGGYGAALVVAVAAVGDAVARLMCGWLADQGWVPLPRLLAVFASLTGLGLLAVGLVPVVGSEEGWGGALLAVAGAYGLSAGSYAPLVFGVLPGLVGVGGVVQATGLVMMLMSLGGLLGPPLSGFLRDETGDFKASFLVCGSFVLSGSFIYMGLPRVLPPCCSASPPTTPPSERGELFPVPRVPLLSAGGPGPTLDTTC